MIVSIICNGQFSVYAEELTSGCCGENVFYEFDSSTGTLTISGSGKMEDYDRNWTSVFEDYNSPFYNQEKIKEIIINYGITSIGDYAFHSCINVEKISIPNSVEIIGRRALYNCSKIESIYIPSSVNCIKEGSFYNCSNLERVDISSIEKWCSISFDGWGSNPLYFAHNLYLNNELVTDLVIPDGVKNISANSFCGCTSINSVKIPNSVTNVGFDAFHDCESIEAVKTESIESWCKIRFEEYSNPINYSKNLYVNDILLTDLKIPDSVTSIGDYSFYNCRCITSIEISKSIKSIGDRAFYDCWNLRSIKIPGNVETIGASSFESCLNVKSVIIENGLKTIGNEAFAHLSNIASIDIPDTVTTIGYGAFNSCSKLNKIKIGTSAVSIGDGAFERTAFYDNIENWDDNVLYLGNHLIKAKKEVSDEYITKNGTISIAGYAFSNCNITNIVIPNSLKAIGAHAFFNCKKLTDISIPNSVVLIDESAFSFCSELKSIKLGDKLEIIGDRVFYKCNKLSEINLPNSLTNIGESVFSECTGLTSIIIPNRVTSIAEEVFSGCMGLKTVTIGSGVKSIKRNAFRSCGELKKISIPKSVTEIADSAFARCYSLETIIVDKDNKVYNSYNNCNAIIETAAKKLIKGCKNTKIPADTKCIGSYAFSYCEGLINVVIPEGITKIESFAFAECKNLYRLSIPNSLVNICASAFFGCQELSRVDIKSIESWLNIIFDLYDEDMTSNPLYYAHDLYINGKKLIDLVIPKSITKINQLAFFGSSINTLAIHDGVSSIGLGAFTGCVNLGKIEVDSNNKYYNSKNNCNAIIETKTKTLISGCFNTKIPNDLEYIGAWSFAFQKKLANISIPDNVQEIQALSFYGCDNLQSIIINKEVKGFGAWSFDDCKNLKHIYYKGSEEEWNSIFMEGGNSFLKNVTVHFNFIPCEEHSVAEDLIEFEISATCKENGERHRITYCSECGEEISREVESINKNPHNSAKTIKTSEILPTYDKEGSYDEVVYCSVCGEEISRTKKTIAKLTKTPLAKASVSGIKDKIYTGKALTQSIIVKLNGKTLKNGTDYKITYKNNKSVGKATVTITGINAYLGTVAKSFKINPKETTVSKISAKSKGFKITWKKQATQTTGYQIQYSTDKNFKKGNKTVTVSKNGTTRKTVSKLKAKKKYYVRIRTYKNVSGTKYYSSWSKAKSVTTKK